MPGGITCRPRERGHSAREQRSPYISAPALDTRREEVVSPGLPNYSERPRSVSPRRKSAADDLDAIPEAPLSLLRAAVSRFPNPASPALNGEDGVVSSRYGGRNSSESGPFRMENETPSREGDAAGFPRVRSDDTGASRPSSEPPPRIRTCFP